MNVSTSQAVVPDGARRLAVEDEPNILQLLSDSLHYDGFHVLRRLRRAGHVLLIPSF